MHSAWLAPYMTWIHTYSRLVYSQSKLNMNGMPYSFPRSAYSTCSERTLQPKRSSLMHPRPPCPQGPTSRPIPRRELPSPPSATPLPPPRRPAPVSSPPLCRPPPVFGAESTAASSAGPPVFTTEPPSFTAEPPVFTPEPPAFTAGPLFTAGRPSSAVARIP